MQRVRAIKELRDCLVVLDLPTCSAAERTRVVDGRVVAASPEWKVGEMQFRLRKVLGFIGADEPPPDRKH